MLPGFSFPAFEIALMNREGQSDLRWSHTFVQHICPEAGMQQRHARHCHPKEASSAKSPLLTIRRVGIAANLARGANRPQMFNGMCVCSRGFRPRPSGLRQTRCAGARGPVPCLTPPGFITHVALVGRARPRCPRPQIGQKTFRRARSVATWTFS